jgi:hypothetical protein
MTYFLKVSEDYEYDTDFTDKLVSWLDINVPREGDIGEVDVHYGMQFMELEEDIHWKRQWDKLYNVYVLKYQKALEQHFGFEMPIKRVANIHKIHCDSWELYRILFCHVEGAETDGIFFYVIEVDDVYMIQFQLTEM